jgi:hypothetical protein
MSGQNKNITIKLLTVSEVRFLMSTDKINGDLRPEDLKIGFSNQLEPDVDNDRISIVFGVRYILEGEIVLESIYKFSFFVKDLSQYIIFNDDNNLTITHIMPHFLSVAVGTMRGILVVKTAGTDFSKYPLPIIDINKLNISLSTLKQ